MADEAEEAVAWIATPYREPVLDSAGDEIGRTESLLGDEETDIFHGVVVRKKSGGELVEVPAARVTRITTERVYTDLSPTDVAELEPYEEEKWFHLGWGGLFRKHPKWKEEGDD